MADEQWRLTIERVYGKDTAIAEFYLGIVRRAATDPTTKRVSQDR